MLTASPLDSLSIHFNLHPESLSPRNRPGQLKDIFIAKNVSIYIGNVSTLQLLFIFDYFCQVFR